MSIIINDTVETYINNLYPDKNEFMGNLRAESEGNSIPIITKDIEKFMDVLIQMNKPKKFLEIGAAVGYSALCYSIVDPDLDITTIEISEKMIIQAKSNIAQMKKTNQITILEGDAKDVLENLEGSFDMIFIDAAKAQYKVYFDLCHKLLAPGGVIISDNILYKGMPVAREFVLKRKRTIAKRMGEYITYITTHPIYDSTVLPVGDGISLSVRKATYNDK